MSWKVHKKAAKAVRTRPAETTSLAAAVAFAVAQLSAHLTRTERFWITLAVGCVAAGVTAWKARSA